MLVPDLHIAVCHERARQIRDSSAIAKRAIADVCKRLTSVVLQISEQSGTPERGNTRRALCCTNAEAGRTGGEDRCPRLPRAH
jgi:hypothetical protein